MVPVPHQALVHLDFHLILLALLVQLLRSHPSLHQAPCHQYYLWVPSVLSDLALHMYQQGPLDLDTLVDLSARTPPAAQQALVLQEGQSVQHILYNREDPADQLVPVILGHLEVLCIQVAPADLAALLVQEPLATPVTPVNPAYLSVQLDQVDPAGPVNPRAPGDPEALAVQQAPPVQADLDPHTHPCVRVCPESLEAPVVRWVLALPDFRQVPVALLFHRARPLQVYPVARECLVDQ